VLVSDGEDHDGDALAAADAAAGQGVLLYTSGFGTLSGAAVPGVESNTGVPIVTRIDENLLRRMAVAAPAGRYVAGDQLADVATEINRLERSSLAEERQLLPVERFQWFALAAAVLLAVELLVPERRWRLRLPQGRHLRLPQGWRLPLRGRGPQLAGVVLLFSFALAVGAACSSAADDLIADGTDAYERGDFADALEAFRSAAADDPDRPEAHYNAGLTLHQLEEYELAASATVRSFPIDDPTDAAHAYYNLGSHYVLLGQLDDAFSAYRQSLLLDPTDGDAKYNLELVRQLMIEQATAEGSPGEEEQPDAGDGSEESGGDTSVGVEARQNALRQELQAALAGAESELTIAEALRALELAQDLNSTLPLADEFSRPSSPDSPNY
jgi:Ca-activated chloride channel family protein